MDANQQAATGGDLPLQGPHSSRPLPHDEWPAAFFPLKLIVQPSGPVLELTRPDMLMGRHSEADVRLPLPDISRRHCRFLFTDRAWQVFDLGSLNGLFINGKQVQHDTLRDHDVLTIGGLQLEVDLSASSSAAGHSATVEAAIRRIAEVLPWTVTDIDSERRAS
jgi:pSer/pThr/pTyr-binding forkhead associated (FHA) protein